MPSRTVYELLFKLVEDSVAGRDILRCVVISFGFSTSDLVEKEGARSFSISVFFDDKDRAKRTLEAFRAMDFKNIAASLLPHEEKDWSTKWKKGWRPFALTRRFHVIPLWQKDRKYPKGKEPIYLDTTNAFGTGLHETTKFTAQIIDHLDGKFQSFLDVGTGSGILAIVAHKLGAKKVDAFDIDPAAVDVARANLKANGLPVKNVVAADIGQFSAKRPYDLVAANLVTHDLLSFKAKLIPCVKPSGRLVVSGISLVNLPLFEKGFEDPRLQRVKVVKGREWAAVLFQRTADQL